MEKGLFTCGLAKLRREVRTKALCARWARITVDRGTIPPVSPVGVEAPPAVRAAVVVLTSALAICPQAVGHHPSRVLAGQTLKVGAAAVLPSRTKLTFHLVIVRVKSGRAWGA